MFIQEIQSRARFRCPELSCFGNHLSSQRIEINSQTNKIFHSILFASTLKKTKNAVDTRVLVLGLLNLSLAGIQDKAVMHCSHAIFLAL